jgi:transposase
MRIHLYCQPKKTVTKGVVNYYSLANSYVDEAGRRQKKIVLRLGRLDDSQAEAYRKILLSTVNPLSALVAVPVESFTVQGSQNYFDVLVLDAIWKKLGLCDLFPSVLRAKQKLSTEHVARILVLNRLLKPCSKVKTMAWFQSTRLDVVMGVDQSAYKKTKIFDELPNIHRLKSLIEKAFVAFSTKTKRNERPGEVEVFYFDGTTSWFEGEECELAKFDLEKTRGLYPQVIGLMMVTDNRGYPLAWDAVDGHVKDTTQLKPLVQRLAGQYNIKNITYCFDRGIASESNFEALNGDTGTKFISGIRDNQIQGVFELDAFVKHTRDKLLAKAKEQKEADKAPREPKRYIADINGFHATSGGKVFFKDLGVDKETQFRYIASFNAYFYEQEQKARIERLKKALFAVDELNHDLVTAKRSRDYNATERDLIAILSKQKVREFFGYTLYPHVTVNEVHSFKIELEPNVSAAEKAAQTDGMMVYVTNHTETHENGSFVVSAFDIVEHYKNKYRIEAFFRSLKSFVELRPFHVWKEAHVKAHYDIAVIACFINNYINESLKKLNTKDDTLSLTDFYTELEKSAPVIQLSAATGTQVRKPMPVSKPLTQILLAMGLASVLEPATHAVHGIHH